MASTAPSDSTQTPENQESSHEQKTIEEKRREFEEWLNQRNEETTASKKLAEDIGEKWGLSIAGIRILAGAIATIDRWISECDWDHYRSGMTHLYPDEHDDD